MFEALLRRCDRGLIPSAILLGVAARVEDGQGERERESVCVCVW